MLKGFSPNFASIRKSQILQLQQKLTPRRPCIMIIMNLWKLIRLLGLPNIVLSIHWLGTLRSIFKCMFLLLWKTAINFGIFLQILGFPHKSLVATSSSSICRTNTVAAPGWSRWRNSRPTSDIGVRRLAPFQADEDIKLNASLGPLRLGIFLGGGWWHYWLGKKWWYIYIYMYTTSLIDYGIKEGSDFFKKVGRLKYELGGVGENES